MCIDTYLQTELQKVYTYRFVCMYKELRPYEYLKFLVKGASFIPPYLTYLPNLPTYLPRCLPR